MATAEINIISNFVKTALISFVENAEDLKTISTESSLLDSGITSFDIVKLILLLERNFRISFPDLLITPANFRSINSIASVTRQLTQDQSGG